MRSSNSTLTWTEPLNGSFRQCLWKGRKYTLNSSFFGHISLMDLSVMFWTAIFMRWHVRARQITSTASNSRMIKDKSSDGKSTGMQEPAIKCLAASRYPSGLGEGSMLKTRGENTSPPKSSASAQRIVAFEICRANFSYRFASV